MGNGGADGGNGARPPGASGAPGDPPQPEGDLGEMTLRDHLIELRKRLFKVIIAIAIAAVAGWFLYNPVLNFLTHPLRQICHHGRCGQSLTGGKLLLTDPLEGLLLRVRISAYVGLLIAMPVVLWQVWRFVAPGLYRNERRYALLFVGSATLLFLGGAVVAYITLAPALTWLQGIAGHQFFTGYSASKYLRLIVYMMLVFGATFQMPIILITLEAIEVVQPRTLLHHWRWGIVITAVVAAIVTPSSDPFSMFALAIPLWVFYFASILVGVFIERRRRRSFAS